jgi:hypothetical protein
MSSNVMSMPSFLTSDVRKLDTTPLVAIFGITCRLT